MSKYLIDYHAFYENSSDVSEEIKYKIIIEETEEFSSAKKALIKYVSKEFQTWNYIERGCGVGFLYFYDKQTKYKQYYQATPIVKPPEFLLGENND